jgi:hypothetical protein
MLWRHSGHNKDDVWDGGGCRWSDESEGSGGVGDSEGGKKRPKHIITTRECPIRVLCVVLELPRRARNCPKPLNAIRSMSVSVLLPPLVVLLPLSSVAFSQDHL